MLKLAKAVASLKAPVRKLRAAPPGEKPTKKTVRLEQLKDAVDKLVEANVHEDAKLETVYKLFCKTLKEDPELQWDRIVKDMHTRDPWEDLKGAKHDGIRGNSSKSLSGNASISISARYILSMPRSSRGCTYYVTSRSLQGPVSEHT